MKRLSLFLALLLLAGCSAEDLAGPDLAPDGARALAAPPSADATTSLAGAWRASDRLGSLTLFIEEARGPAPSTPQSSTVLEGKGIVSGLLEAPVAVSVKGTFADLEVNLLLTDARGETVAKARGLATEDLMSIKVVMEDATGQERRLSFSRL